uniref:non-specific serine/threonine protein kinase n=1 Tax=Cyanothece sp. (strain PCC 7425 / ATCC 29141) TaxID=395961 RepID=B8HL42_CYAP4
MEVLELRELRGYRILRPLGQGGFGKTFLVEDTQSSSHQQYVVKQLSFPTTDPSKYKIVRESFQREATVLLELSNKHSQIPKLYSYFFHDENFYLVQEYIEGLTLAEKVKQEGGLEEALVQQILIEILQILDVIHRENIIHRDVKPDNIIISKVTNKPVLIDFGAVKECVHLPIQQGGSTTVIVGTPGFMAPEQAMGHPTFVSDIYSLGITALYLLTGRSPQDYAPCMASHNFSWREYAAHLSPALAAVLEKAVQFHPADRYRSAQEMLLALEDLTLEGKPFTPGSAPLPLPTVQKLPPTRHSGISLEQASAKRSFNLTKSSRLVWGTLGTLAFAASAAGLGGVYTYRQQQNQAMLQTALEFQQQGQFQACLDRLDNLEASPQVEELRARCQLVAAKAMARKGQLAMALQQIQQIPSATVRSESRFLQKQWSGQILELAEVKYQQGQLDQAKGMAQAIPAGNPSQVNAQRSIQRWEAEWQRNATTFQAAQIAQRAGNWPEVIAQARRLNTPYWLQKVRPLLSQAIDRQAFQQRSSVQQQQASVYPTSRQTAIAPPSAQQTSPAVLAKPVRVNKVQPDRTVPPPQPAAPRQQQGVRPKQNSREKPVKPQARRSQRQQRPQRVSLNRKKLNQAYKPKAKSSTNDRPPRAEKSKGRSKNGKGKK